MKKTFLLALLCLLSTATLFSQDKSQTNSLLWKVSGKGLTKPTYLFGTYHFLTNAFVDTLPAVKQAYKASQVVVGEIVIDSSMQAPMMEASMLKGTTLKKELPEGVYAKTAGWFNRESGIDLAKLDQLNPLSVMIFAMAITQQKYYPTKAGEIQLDSYFQQTTNKDGKKVMGLETVEAQINALYGGLTMQRQIALLHETLNEEDGLKKMIGIMNKAYISQNLEELQELMYGTYKPEEMKAMLEERNNEWMKQLPKLMKEQPLFVAVGALHLAGESGLVNQLRKQGYTLTPIKL
jgi:uncharacterized protein YbaP (TraB family)